MPWPGGSGVAIYARKPSWTDQFVAVERWVEGDRRERMLRDEAPWHSLHGG